MGIRRNAKFLDATEQENFVRACVMMKADIVNPSRGQRSNPDHAPNLLRRKCGSYPESTPKGSTKKSPTVKGKSKK